MANSFEVRVLIVNTFCDPRTSHDFSDREMDRGARSAICGQPGSATIPPDRTRLSDQFCYSEEEAARSLGLEKHQLRDARLAGKIQCSQITGRRIRYTREDLLRYVETTAGNPRCRFAGLESLNPELRNKS
jgi:hypothetical protein